MKKLSQETKYLVQDNIEAIAKLFPHCITEKQMSNGGGTTSC